MTNIMQTRPISLSVVWNTGVPKQFSESLVNGVRAEDCAVRCREKEIIVTQPVSCVFPVITQQFQQGFRKWDQPVPPVFRFPDREDAFLQIHIPAKEPNRF